MGRLGDFKFLEGGRRSCVYSIWQGKMEGSELGERWGGWDVGVEGRGVGGW